MHIGNTATKAKVILFTTESLKNCYEKKEIRARESKRKSKYDAITLPESADGHTGYHASCYRCFTNIRSKQPAVAEIERKNQIEIKRIAFK